MRSSIGGVFGLSVVEAKTLRATRKSPFQPLLCRQRTSCEGADEAAQLRLFGNDCDTLTPMVPPLCRRRGVEGTDHSSNCEVTRVADEVTRRRDAKMREVQISRMCVRVKTKEFSRLNEKVNAALNEQQQTVFSLLR